MNVPYLIQHLYDTMSIKSRAVLATSPIRPLNQAFQHTFTCLSQLAASSEEEDKRNAFICSFSEGEIDTVHGILPFIKRLTGLCLQSLHHRFRDWTKPDTAPSLMVGVLTDFARSTSELVAANALLRKPLMIHRRQVKRPVCTRADRMLLVLRARVVRTWKQALLIVQQDDTFTVASSGMRGCIGNTNREQDLPYQRSRQRPCR
jgi:hypothetical protein